MDHRPPGGSPHPPALVAEARVETERSARYLVQLCRHVSHVAQMNPQMQAQVEWSDDRGVISLGLGRCTLRAESGVLTLRAEAPDEESLLQLEQRVADRLEQIGRRDHLAVNWQPHNHAAEPLPEPPPRPSHTAAGVADLPSYPTKDHDAGVEPAGRSTRGGSRWVGVVGIVLAAAFVALIIVAHLTGLIGPGLHGPGGTPAPSPSVTQTLPGGGR